MRVVVVGAGMSGLIAATDPVASDSVGREIIDRRRADAGLEPGVLRRREIDEG